MKPPIRSLLADPATGRQRKVHTLIFTAVYSRHMFVWLSFTRTLAAFIAGCEAAWVRRLPCRHRRRRM